MLIQSNAQRIPLRDKSVHMCVTSPPYWSLRDYGTGRWVGGDGECEHEPDKTSPTSTLEGGKTTQGTAKFYRDTCPDCGATRIDDQLGLEPTPEEYVANMVAVFREVWRVLRDDGTCWVNLGDGYNANQGKGFKPDGGRNIAAPNGFKPPKVPNLKPKDLCGIPWRVALALQADGWYLRSDIIWSKPNPMPESCKDRPTKAHEYLFLLSKKPRYYYDADAVREAQAPGTFERFGNGQADRKMSPKYMGDEYGTMKEYPRTAILPAGRNRRTVWHIATRPYAGAHFATFPPDLVEPCIKAGTSERGVCPECSAPWERVVERESYFDGNSARAGRSIDEINASGKWIDPEGTHKNLKGGPKVNTTTLGWRPTCECWRDMPAPNLPRTKNKRKRKQQDAGGYWKFRAVARGGKTEPATVLDPFSGAATTGLVSKKLNRRYVGTDLSMEYHRLARERLGLVALEAWTEGKPIAGGEKDSNGYKNMQTPGQKNNSFHETRVKPDQETGQMQMDFSDTRLNPWPIKRASGEYDV